MASVMAAPIEEPSVSRELIERAMARFAVVRLAAAKQYPFLGEGIFAMTPRPVPGLRKQCGGWAMDKYGRCYFDPEMILGLGEDGDVPLASLAAIYIHEVWHFLRRHHWRFETLQVSGVKSMKLWNIAADAEINGADSFLREHLPEWAIFPEKLADGNGSPLPGNLLAEQYYARLFRNQEEEEEDGKGEGESPGGGNECMSEEPRDFEDGPPAPSKPGLEKTEGEDLRKRVAKSIKDSSSAHSYGHAGLQEWAEEELKPPVIAWQEVTRRFARRSMEMGAGAADFTFSRRSRRQGVVQSNVILPAAFQPRLRIGAVIDTSGSMSDKDLSAASSEITGIAAAAGGTCVVITGDTDIGWSGNASSGRDVRYSARGGTDMRPLIEAAAKSNPQVHCIIVLTDGYTPWPERGEIQLPVLVGLIGRHCRPESVPDWMTVVEID